MRGLLLAITSCAVSPAALADGEAGPGRYKYGISGGLSYTDNFYYQTVGAKESVFGLILAPEFAFLAQTSKAELGALARLESGLYNTSGGHDNYLDSAGGLRFAWNPTSRDHYAFNAGLQNGHDPFGIVRTEGTAAAGYDIDTWRQTAAGARYRYGSAGATVNAQIGVAATDKNYTSNEAFTQLLDYRSTTVDYGLSYSYSPKTSALLNFSRTGVSFDHPFDNNAGPGGSDLDDRSGNIYQLLGGARWLATAKTSGEVRAGYRRRTFDNLTVTLEGFDWQAGIDWAPSPRTLLQLKTARAEDESYYLDAFAIDTKSYSLTAKRSVSGRLRVNGGIERVKANFFGTSRNDTATALTAGFERTVSTRIFLVGNLGYAKRDSTVDSRDYRRLNAFVGVRWGSPG